MHQYETLPSLQPSEQEKVLDAQAQVPRPNDGSYNTVFKASQKNLIWRVSKGNDRKKREKHINDWIKERGITDVFAGLHVAPQVEKEYSRGSWLTDNQLRVAALQVEYTEDLHDALGPPRRGKISLAYSEQFGIDVGRFLVWRLCQLGAACTLHGDLKPENVLLLLPKYKNGVTLSDVKIIDFDPQFLFTGCNCVRAQPNVQVALFAVLNLVLFWTWFEVDEKIGSGRSAASRECHKELTRALETSILPLDELAPSLPPELMERLETWALNYRDKKLQGSVPILQAAVARFGGLRAQQYRRASGPHVAGELVSANSFASSRPLIETARSRLQRIAQSIIGMTCSQL